MINLLIDTSPVSGAQGKTKKMQALAENLFCRRIHRIRNISGPTIPHCLSLNQGPRHLDMQVIPFVS